MGLETLPARGSVLDVGCGAGAAGLSLVPPAGLLVGVDAGAGMLAAFAERAAARGVRHLLVEGRWPDVATRLPLSMSSSATTCPTSARSRGP